MALVEDITNTIQKLIEQIQRRLGSVGKQAGELVGDGRGKLDEAVHKSEGVLSEQVGKVKGVVHKSEGVLSEQVGKVKGVVHKSEGVLSEQVGKVKGAMHKPEVSAKDIAD